MYMLFSTLVKIVASVKFAIVPFACRKNNRSSFVGCDSVVIRFGLGLCEIYERNKGVTEYTVQDVVDYFRSFEEVMFLEYDNELSNYVPYDTDTVCRKIQELAPV